MYSADVHCLSALLMYTIDVQYCSSTLTMQQMFNLLSEVLHVMSFKASHGIFVNSSECDSLREAHRTYLILSV